MPVGGVVSNAISGGARRAGARVGGFCWELSVSRKVCRHAGVRVTGCLADTARLGV